MKLVVVLYTMTLLSLLGYRSLGYQIYNLICM